MGNNNDIFNVQVSVYNGMRDNIGAVASIRQFLSSKRHIGEILRMRGESSPDERKRIKSLLPAATLSGVFSPSRAAGNLVEHSGFICVDIDGKDNPGCDMGEMKQYLSRCRNIAFMGISVGGAGLFCLIPITTPSCHKEHFRALQNDFKRMGITIDAACKDVSRMRVLSYDPEPYENQSAAPYPFTCKESPQVCRVFNKYRGADETICAIENIVCQCEQLHVDITDGYDDWFKAGAALASLGEAGRAFYHRLSAISSKYNPGECDRKFNNLLRTCGQVGIGSLFYVAKAHGIIASPTHAGIKNGYVPK